MRYDIILFKPFVDIAVVCANACFPPHLLLYNTNCVTMGRFVIVVVHKGHFGVAVRKILENH